MVQEFGRSVGFRGSDLRSDHTTIRKALSDSLLGKREKLIDLLLHLFIFVAGGGIMFYKHCLVLFVCFFFVFFFCVVVQEFGRSVRCRGSHLRSDHTTIRKALSASLLGKREKLI